MSVCVIETKKQDLVVYLICELVRTRPSGEEDTGVYVCVYVYVYGMVWMVWMVSHGRYDEGF